VLQACEENPECYSAAPTVELVAQLGSSALSNHMAGLDLQSECSVPGRNSQVSTTLLSASNNKRWSSSSHASSLPFQGSPTGSIADFASASAASATARFDLDCQSTLSVETDVATVLDRHLPLPAANWAQFSHEAAQPQKAVADDNAGVWDPIAGMAGW
jgi:hypothetical protein